MNPYKFIYVPEKKKVICVSHYAGKPVRGIAKCSPTDEYDGKIGETLARLRCDCKVAQLRHARAQKKWEEANEMFLKADAYLSKCEQYLWDSEEKMDDAAGDLMDFIDTI